jgi:SH3 domain-containing YSC84-like protein 1
LFLRCVENSDATAVPRAFSETGTNMTTPYSLALRALIVTVSMIAVHRADGQVMVPANPSDQVVLNATGVLAQTMTMQSGIPQNLLAGAQGIVIVPNMIRGAFIFGAQYGRGVLLVRNPQGGWQAPRMVTMAGGSFGYQIGVQATDLVLVFRTPQSVANLLAGTLKLGVDASAAAGPIGRQTSAATDLQLGAEILSYSRARGLFAGVALDGSVISLDPAADALYYQPPGTMPASAMQLLQVVNAYSAAPPMVAAPGQIAGGVGWMPQGTANVEATRQQLDTSSRQLAANLDDAWKTYLALPPELYTPNQVPSPQALQQSLTKYEDVACKPEYAALTSRADFKATLKSLRQLSNTRTASNTLQLPPPPR